MESYATPQQSPRKPQQVSRATPSSQSELYLTLTLVDLRQQNPDPNQTRQNPKQDSAFSSARIASPSDLVVLRSLGTPSVGSSGVHTLTTFVCVCSGSGSWGRVVMAQISNSTSSLVAVKVFPKEGFRLTGEVRIIPLKHEPHYSVTNRSPVRRNRSLG